MKSPAPGTKTVRPFLALGLVLGLLASGAARAATPAVPFPSGLPWQNVARPLTLQDVRGRVVLLDFFTPGCINCVHILPELARLEREFGQDLVIIGVNTPKFTASQNDIPLRRFLERYHIDHPVVTDAGYRLWNAYGVFAWPTLIVIDPRGEVAGEFIGEGHYASIRRDVAGLIAQARAAGTLDPRPLPLRPLAGRRAAGALLGPDKVAVAGRWVAVADTGHNRVLLLDRQGVVRKVIGNGRAGWADGPAAQAEFDRPEGLAFDGDDLYVADAVNNAIRRVSLRDFAVRTVASNDHGGATAMPQSALSTPWGLEVVGHALYIAMAGEHQIWRMTLPDGPIGVYAGTGAEGIHDGARLQASFAQSSGLAHDAGTLYVADPEASAIRAIDLETGRVRTLVGRGLFVFGDRNGPAAQALLQHPQGLAYANDALYIADTYNNQIRRLDLRTLAVSRVAPRHGGPGALDQPGGLALFDPHTLLIADTDNNRLVQLDLASGRLRPWPIRFPATAPPPATPIPSQKNP